MKNNHLVLRGGVGRQGSTVVTDKEGKYLARVLAGRVYTQVIILPSKIGENYTQPGAPWSEYQEVHSEVAENLLRSIELTPITTIHGQLLNKDRKPVVNCQVMGIKDSRRYGHSRTDANGKFSIEVPKKIEVAFEVWTDQHSGPVANRIVQKDPLIIQLGVSPQPP